MLNSLTKINIEKTIAKQLGKKAFDVCFSGSKVTPSPSGFIYLMVKADGKWFDVEVEQASQVVGVMPAA